MAAFINTGAVTVVAALVALYVLGVSRSADRVTDGQKFLFGCAAAALLIALGPMDAIAVGRRFFVMLMAEHFVLALIVPPLLIRSTTPGMLRPWMLSRPLRPLFRFTGRLFISFVLFSLLFGVPHYALLLDTACSDWGLRLALNLILVLAGLVMWWPLLSPLPEFPRPSPANRILYLFLLLIPMSAVASPITLSHSVLYSWYAHGPHPMNLTPMEDQVLGGLLLWIGMGFYLVGVFTAVFFRWSMQEETSRPSDGNPRRPSLKTVTPHRARP